MATLSDGSVVVTVDVIIGETIHKLCRAINRATGREICIGLLS